MQIRPILKKKLSSVNFLIFKHSEF
jgi:hypothetical protein